ncbi:MAG TPA: hypothetical protein VF476_10870 [Chitinophagaceae bacterium]
MKNRTLTLFSTTLLIFSLLIVTSISCSKEKSDGTTNNAEQEAISATTAESDAEAEIIYNGIFDDVMGNGDDVGMAGTGWYGRSTTSTTRPTDRVTACYTLTVTHLNASNLFPVRVVLDFGTTGCQGPDGHIRRGKIITEYSSRLIVPGATAETSFENFYFDSIKVQGIHKITNTSSPVNTQPLSRSFKFEVIDGKLTRPSGNYIEWRSTKTITQTEGLITPDRPIDDIFRIEGSSRGKAQRGNLLVAWESSIVEPLIKRFLCRWIVKGKIKMVRLNTSSNDAWVATLDFGNGATPPPCDNQATLTVNGRSRQITLP